MSTRTAHAKLEGWLVLNVGSAEAEECLKIVGEIVSGERDACIAIANANSVPGHTVSKAVVHSIVEAIRARGK